MDELRTKNHYIPSLYLKQWLDESKKIHVYKILVSHSKHRVWKKYYPQAIAYHKHLYTQMVAGVENDHFERWLDSRYESPAQNAIQKAISDQQLSRNDWHKLIRFLACQDVRTPARLLEHLNRCDHQKELQKSISEIVSRLESDPSTLERESSKVSHNDQNFPLKVTTELDSQKEMGLLKVESYVGRATWIHSMKHLLEFAEKVLLQHKWTIVKPAKGYCFFTSDNPVIKLNYRDENNYDFGGGWGRAKGNIIFPLGPQHAMFVEIGGKPPLRGSRLSEEATRELRKFTVEHAHRMIFTNAEDHDVPHLRPRVINNLAVKKEQQQLKHWHEQNSILEMQFSKDDNSV